MAHEGKILMVGPGGKTRMMSRHLSSQKETIRQGWKPKPQDPEPVELPPLGDEHAEDETTAPRRRRKSPNTEK